MMAKDYSGLDARAALGGADLGLDGTGQVAIGSPWNGTEIIQVHQTISQLQQGNQVDTLALDQATQSVKRGLGHPTYAMNSQELIKAMYNLNSTAEAQAHVVGSILEPDRVDLLRNLLTSADEANPLAERLGPQGIQRLLGIAVDSNPIARTIALCQWARETILPESSHDKGELERSVKSGLGDGDSESRAIISGFLANISESELVAAILDNDVETIEAIVLQAESEDVVTALAQGVAALLGERARPEFERSALSEHPQCQQFGFQGLLTLAESNMDQEQTAQAKSTAADPDVQTGDGQSVGAIIDATALESLLSVPDSLPASLAARFGCSPAVQACLLELIVRD